VETIDVFFLATALAYLVLQFWALNRLAGAWRLAAATALLAMVAVIAAGFVGGAAGSNLAPMWIFIALPAATLYLASPRCCWRGGFQPGLGQKRA
jgi:hypothetical protein